MIEFKFVGVEWNDPHSIDEWADFKDLKNEACPVCKAVGYVIDENKDRIVLSPAVDPKNEEGCTNLVIPKGVIIRIIEADDPWTQEALRKEEKKKSKKKKKPKGKKN